VSTYCNTKNSRDFVAIDGETEVLQAGDAAVPASPVMGLLHASIDTDGVSVQGFVDAGEMHAMLFA
jgi:hypothetical protein